MNQLPQMNWNKVQKTSNKRCNVYSTVRPAGMCYWGSGGNNCCNSSGLQLRVGLSGHCLASTSPSTSMSLGKSSPFQTFHWCTVASSGRYPRESCRCVTAWRGDRDVCAEDVVLNRKPGLMIHRWLGWLECWSLGFVMVHVCDLFGCYCGRGPWQRGWVWGWMGVGS